MLVLSIIGTNYEWNTIPTKGLQFKLVQDESPHSKALIVISTQSSIMVQNVEIRTKAYG